MESHYYRTFIGLPLQVDPVFLKARAHLMKALAGERISWTNPDQYHITLRFLGDTSVSSLEEIGQALHAGVNVHRQEQVDLRGLNSFGSRRAPRVIWVGFKEKRFFEERKREVDQALESCGIPVPDQTFRAHLTLGRVRSLRNLALYYQIIEGMDRQFKGSVLFEKLVFFRSILGAGGPEYRILDEIRFQ